MYINNIVNACIELVLYVLNILICEFWCPESLFHSSAQNTSHRCHQAATWWMWEKAWNNIESCWWIWWARLFI